MKAPTADETKEVRARLDALGFPNTHAAQVKWCRENVMKGLVERDAITEKFMDGMPIAEIARKVGVSELRVYHFLSRGPEMQSAPGDPWRFISEAESYAEAS